MNSRHVAVPHRKVSIITYTIYKWYIPHNTSFQRDMVRLSWAKVTCWYIEHSVKKNSPWIIQITQPRVVRKMDSDFSNLPKIDGMAWTGFEF
jgi:hypothetical protein